MTDQKSSPKVALTPSPDAASKAPSLAAKNARSLTGSALSSALVVSSYSGTSGDPVELMKVLGEQAEAVQNGDMKQVEAMLFDQAVAMQSMFCDLATRAKKQQTLEGVQCYTQLALRAQAGCRATLQALAEVKNPRQVAFVKQTNVAHNQQVNNGVPQPSRTEKVELAPNELLAEENHGRTTLDKGAKTTAKRPDPPVGAVDPVHRPIKRRR